MTDDVIRVLLVDDHAVVRAGLRAVLAGARDIAIVGEAAEGTAALALAERLRPDVVVTDLAMAGMDGIALTREMVARHMPSKVLVLTVHGEDEYLLPAVEAGVSGYLLKNAADRELVDAVRGIARGDGYFRAAAGRLLGQRLARPTDVGAQRERFEALTARERDVLVLVAEGYTAPDIGGRMGISPKTVDTYKHRVQEKLGFHHRSDYVRFALRLGLLHA